MSIQPISQPIRHSLKPSGTLPAIKRHIQAFIQRTFARFKPASKRRIHALTTLMIDGCRRTLRLSLNHRPTPGLMVWSMYGWLMIHGCLSVITATQLWVACTWLAPTNSKKTSRYQSLHPSVFGVAIQSPPNSKTQGPPNRANAPY